MHFFSTLLTLAVPLFSALHASGQGVGVGGLDFCNEVYSHSFSALTAFKSHINYSPSGEFVSKTYASSSDDDATSVSYTAKGTTITTGFAGPQKKVVVSFTRQKSQLKRFFEPKNGDSCAISDSDVWSSLNGASFYK